MTCVLGHPRVLDARAADPQWRDTEHRCDRVVGVAALEPLYGRAAELAIAVEDPADHELCHRLLAAATRRARAAGIHLLRWAPGTQHDAPALEITGTTSAAGVTSLRLADVDCP